MAERTITVCDVCGEPAVERMTMEVGARTLVKDLCEQHLKEAVSGARRAKRGGAAARAAAAAAERTAGAGRARAAASRRSPAAKAAAKKAWAKARAGVEDQSRG